MGARTNLSVPGILDIAYSYDSRGRLAGILGNGKTTTFAYDAAGQLLSLDHRSPVGTPIATFAYAYDLSGNRTAMTTLEGPHAFAYDAQNQLLSAAYPDGSSETFCYDPVGNRTSLVAVAAGGLSTNITIYTYGSGNRLLSDASATTTNTYAYDGAGRLTNHVVNGLPRTIAYDFQGRMTTLTDTNGAVFTYTFDAEGNRRSQSLNDCLETRFVHDGPNVVLELGSTNQLLASYINAPGIDRPLERTFYLGGVPRQIRTFHADALGSIAALSDPAGLPVQTYAYAAFGALRSQSGPDPNRITYTARDLLGESQGWMYYRSRIYIPVLGRFGSFDPFGFIETANGFIYVSNKSTLQIDPWGYWGIQFGDINFGVGNPCLVFDSSSWGDLGRGMAATADGIIPFFNPFSSFYEDENGDIDSVYEWSRAGGKFGRNVLLMAAGLRGGATFGGTRAGHWLNHNRYIRMGPGRMPARGGLPSGPKVPRLSIWNKPNGPHCDLRVRPVD